MTTRLRGTRANPWDEFGTTTGRPRRVGWLDAVLLRYAKRINGLTELVLTKLDVLSGIETIKVCTNYQDEQGKQYQMPEFGVCDLERYQPVYAQLKGWQTDLTKIRFWADLPEEARAYVRFIEKMTGLPVSMVSVGPERSQIIVVPVA
jgi:adenylosuccinate synthase